MANYLNIEEYGRLAQAEHGSELQVPGPLLRNQRIDITATSVASGVAMGSETKFAVLTAGAPARFNINATADSGSRYIPSNTPRTISVNPDDVIHTIAL